MTTKRNEDNESGKPPKASAKVYQPRHEVGHTVRMITANDRGWITPTAFVAPIRMVPIDPPRATQKKSPPAA